MTSATAASTVEPSDQNKLATSEPPCLRSSPGKRRSATSATMAGVIRIATNSSATMTITGMLRNSKIVGASTTRRLPRPRPSSQRAMVPSNSHPSRPDRTEASASSQKK